MRGRLVELVHATIVFKTKEHVLLRLRSSPNIIILPANTSEYINKIRSFPEGDLYAMGLFIFLVCCQIYIYPMVV